MKKIILLTFVVVLFSACGDKITEVTEVVEPFSHSLYVTIRPNEWKMDEDATGVYFYREISEPKLTTEVLEYGIMQAFYRYRLDENDNADRYAPLPYEDYWIDNYIQHFTVEFSEGLVTLIYKTSLGEEYPPSASYSFLVRFLW